MEDDSKPRYTSRKQIYGEPLWHTNCSVHGHSLTVDGHCTQCIDEWDSALLAATKENEDG